MNHGSVDFCNLVVTEEYGGANLPVISTLGSACADLAVLQEITIRPQSHVFARTGLVFNIEPGYHAKIYPRSSTTKLGILMPTSIIDSDYKGEVHLSMVNYTDHDIIIHEGERVAQYEIVEDGFFLDGTLQRAKTRDGGMGSTGKASENVDKAIDRLFDDNARKAESFLSKSSNDPSINENILLSRVATILEQTIGKSSPVTLEFHKYLNKRIALIASGAVDDSADFMEQELTHEGKIVGPAKQSKEV